MEVITVKNDLSLTISRKRYEESKNDEPVFGMKGIGRSATIMNEDDLPDVANLLRDALQEVEKLIDGCNND